METQIGRYQVVEELGRGGMGVVYRAVDPVIERTVALKTIRNSEGIAPRVYEEMRERFLREARAAGRLNHPAIVGVLDAGTDEKSGVSFIAMEFIKGQDLDSEIRSGRRYTVEEAVEIVATVAEALDYAHEQGVVHRDVKPANLLRDASGKIKITDFGIAHLAESGLTRTGQVLGSPAYMSPEQITGAPVDRRSDIFSLGVVLYQLLTGERPFLGEGLSTLSYQIVHTEPIPPGKLNPTLPQHLEHALGHALAKSPADRYARARDLVRDLRDATTLDAALPRLAVAPGPTGTLVGAAQVGVAPARSGTLLEAPLPARSAAPARPRWLVPAAAALVVLAGLLGYALVGHRGAPSSDRAAVAPGDPARDTQRQAGDGRRTLEESARQEKERLQEEAQARAEEARRAEERRAEEARSRTQPAAAGTARLLIDFEHHLSSGSVTVRVDGAEAWSSPLRARKETRFKIPGVRKGPSLKLAHEDLSGEAQVAAGVRKVKVTVSSPGNEVEDTETVMMDLRPEERNVLRIRVSRLTRRVELATFP